MNTKLDPDLGPSRTLVALAFATVYLVWGSTFLAMRVAVETFPPFAMAACRFVLAGSVLLLWLRSRGAPWPDRRQWRNATITGTLMLVTGNGFVAWAEQTVPSGLAALLLALTPAWFVVLDWGRPGGARPHPKTVIGVLIGFSGILVLSWHPGSGSGAGHVGVDLLGLLALVFAGCSWAAGSLYSKHRSRPDSTWTTAALQMFCGGLALALVAWPAGDWHQLARQTVSVRSLVAVLYLVVFGSWIGFGAYTWLLKASKPSHVSTYAYVNPVVALILGNLVLNEPLNGRIFLAGAVILTGVLLITMPGSVVRFRWRPLPVKPGSEEG